MAFEDWKKQNETLAIEPEPVSGFQKWKSQNYKVDSPQFTPEEAGNNAVKGLASASKPDAIDSHEKQVQYFYNYMKKAPKSEREGWALTRFSDPLGLRKYLSRKFGSGEESAWFEALDSYSGELPWTSEEKWRHFAVGAEQAGAVFKAFGAAKSLAGVAVRFAAYEGIQAPREDETVGERAKAMATGAAFGVGTGLAGKFIPKARYRIPATVSGSMLVTAVGGGTSKQILDSGAEMLGWEAIGLAQRGMDRFSIAKSARTHNPELNKTPADEIERSVKQMADIDTTLKTMMTPDKPGEKPTTKPAEGETPVKPVTGEGVAGKQAEVKQGVDLTETNKMLLDHLDTARKLRADEVEPAIKELHARQAGKATSELQKGLAGGMASGAAIRKSKKGYADRAIVPEIEPPPLSENQWNQYSDRILEVYPAESTKGQFLRSNAQDAFDRLRDGKILTNYELQILEPILGRDTTTQIYDKLRKYRSPAERKWEMLRSIIGFWKTPFATDVQFIRQASSLAARHPVEYAKSTEVALKAYASKDFTEKAIKEVAENPNHEDAKRSGMNFIPDTPYAGEKPEQYISSLPESMATLGEKRNIIAKVAASPIRGYGKWLMSAERSFVASTNHFMQNLWDSQAKIWSQSLSEFEKTNPDKKTLNKFRAEQETEKENYADTINTFMKLLKAKSPTGKAIMKVANLILFSPSMTFSRPRRLKVLAMNKGSRLYAAQIIGTEVGKLVLLSALATSVAAKFRAENPDEEPPIDSDMNPLSSNWGKIKIKNTYYDFGGGDIQFYRTLARLVTLHSKNQAGEIRPIEFWETVKNYGQQRETAFIGTLAELISGKDYMGKPISAIDAVTMSQIPQFAENIYQATKTDGIAQGLLAGAAGLSSAGVSSYQPAGKTEETLMKNKLSQAEYKMDWNDLSPMAQNRITRANRQEITAAEQKTNKERIERQDDSYLMRIRKAEREGGEGVLKLMSPESRQIIKDNGIEVGLARTAGDWSMNDKRFEQYQQLTAEYLNTKLTSLIDRPIWDRITVAQKQDRIENEIAMAKARARNTIIREANKETK
jgi:hypothetical protein